MGERLASIFEGLDPFFLPDRFTRSGSRSFPMDWRSGGHQLPGVWHSASGDVVQLIFSDRAGWIMIDSTAGPRAAGQSINVYLDYRLVSERGLLGQCVQLLERLVSLTGASHGAAFLTAAHPRGGWIADSPREADFEGLTITHAPYGPFQFLEVHWIDVFGREYVQFFGKDRLRSVDAYRVSSDSEGRVWIQVTEKPEDLVRDFDRIRLGVIQSLGVPGAFYSPGVSSRTAEYLAPEFDYSEQRVRSSP